MRKLMVAIGCCMLCLVFMGCPGPEGHFWFRLENKSSEPISCVMPLTFYRDPDGTQDTSTIGLLGSSFTGVLHIQPNGHSMYYYRDHNLSYHYERIRTGIMPIYIFSIDTINKYTWQETLANGRILQRYDLSYKDIESLGFVIPYPPTEAMRDMKMWPRYKSEVE